MGICMRYLGDQDESKSAVNQSFLKIISNLDKWDESRPFEAWAKRITINTVIDICRQNNARTVKMPLTHVEDLNENWAGIAVNEAAARLDTEQLEFMISSLPEMHRSVFNMYAIDGYTHSEIAAMLNCSVSASKWYLHQARKLLQEQLEAYLIAEKKYQHG